MKNIILFGATIIGMLFGLIKGNFTILIVGIVPLVYLLPSVEKQIEAYRRKKNGE